jgi:acyl-CoA oxidase
VFETWNRQVEQVRRLAETHGRRSAAAALFAAADRATDLAARAVLEDLAEVYTLGCVEESFGWYVGHGLLGPKEATDLETRRARLHGDLADRLPLLTTAFAIPDRILRSPLATDDYLAAYEDWLDAAASGEPSAATSGAVPGGTSAGNSGGKPGGTSAGNSGGTSAGKPGGTAATAGILRIFRSGR